MLGWVCGSPVQTREHIPPNQMRRKQMISRIFRKGFFTLSIFLVLIALGLTPPLGVLANTNYTDTFDSAFAGTPTSLTTGSSTTGLSYNC